MAFSLPLCPEEAEIEGVVDGRPWVSLLGPRLWWFGWSGIMARGKAIGALSSSCPCWSADHSSLAHYGSGDGALVMVGRSLWVSFGLAVGDFMSFAS